jgi:hypothetical protein
MRGIPELLYEQQYEPELGEHRGSRVIHRGLRYGITGKVPLLRPLWITLLRMAYKPYLACTTRRGPSNLQTAVKGD